MNKTSYVLYWMLTLQMTLSYSITQNHAAIFTFYVPFNTE